MSISDRNRRTSSSSPDDGGTIDRLLFPPDLWDRMIEHARLAFPEEAVGVLGGSGPWMVDRVLPLRNLASYGAVLADPFAQFLAERSLRNAGLQLIGVYHSHPAGGRQPSPTDRIAAELRPGVVQVIVALPDADGECEVRGYLIEGVRTFEVPVGVRPARRLG